MVESCSHGVSGMEPTRDTAFQALADSLRRPPASLAPLAALPEARLQTLTRLVDDACARDEAMLRADLRRLLPWPLPALLRLFTRQRRVP